MTEDVEIVFAREIRKWRLREGASVRLWPDEYTAADLLLASRLLRIILRQQEDADEPLRLESWDITPECRANRGVNGAWIEACERLHGVYSGQTTYMPGVTLRLSIERVRIEDVTVDEVFFPESQQEE